MSTVVNFFLVLSVVSDFNYRAVMDKVEQLIERLESPEAEREGRFFEDSYATFDSNGNLWLRWDEWTKLSREELIEGRKDIRTFRMVQKIKSDGTPAFPPVNIERGRILYLDNQGNSYSFPYFAVGPVDFNIVKVDADGNLHKFLLSGGIFVPLRVIFDNSGLMHVFSEYRGKPPGTGSLSFRWLIYTKILPVPTPTIIEERPLGSRRDSLHQKHIWVHFNNIFHLTKDNLLTAILPERIPEAGCRLGIRQFNLSNISHVDTSSFKVEEYVFKKITGCRLNKFVLRAGHGDTILAFIPIESEKKRLIYVCKLNKNGRPIKSPSIKTERVMSFDHAPEDLLYLFYRTSVYDKYRAILFYGFDRDGNVYCYVSPKSDEFWKVK